MVCSKLDKGNCIVLRKICGKNYIVKMTGLCELVKSARPKGKAKASKKKKPSGKKAAKPKKQGKRRATVKKAAKKALKRKAKKKKRR